MQFYALGYLHHASKDDPQYEIKSSTTDHFAMHKGVALTIRSDANEQEHYRSQRPVEASI
jgi:hypothetical protein